MFSFFVICLLFFICFVAFLLFFNLLLSLYYFSMFLLILYYLFILLLNLCFFHFVWPVRLGLQSTTFFYTCKNRPPGELFAFVFTLEDAIAWVGCHYPVSGGTGVVQKWKSSQTANTHGWKKRRPSTKCWEETKKNRTLTQISEKTKINKM